jgi:hypothetical protein
MMTVKLFATGVAAVAAIGAAAAGASSLASSGATTPQVVSVVLSAPLDPPPPAPGQPPLPSPEQLADLCNQVTNPGVSYKTKFGLVENGISSQEGHDADHLLRRAFEHGDFPEQFAVTNIEPIPAPNAVKATVAITGPKFPEPVTQDLVFIDQGGTWVLQHDAALALVKAATAVN